jgi:hypothetical protein
MHGNIMMKRVRRIERGDFFMFFSFRPSDYQDIRSWGSEQQSIW